MLLEGNAINEMNATKANVKDTKATFIHFQRAARRIYFGT